ncbi:unnamed protein product [Ceutorhynchus assimilis]|uniref:CCHC-type domain-containing protein n=1 Tax=Ceutorhynchus assimilis TaxID=467358 RepID=A0A9N9MJ91_9CUCU|nr:unnamed protein product [Ceutorhynchus assimilis]
MGGHHRTHHVTLRSQRNQLGAKAHENTLANGRFDKRKGICFFKNAKCNLCKKVGHLARMCKTDSRNRRKIHFVEENAENEDEYNQEYVDDESISECSGFVDSSSCSEISEIEYPQHLPGAGLSGQQPKKIMREIGETAESLSTFYDEEEKEEKSVEVPLWERNSKLNESESKIHDASSSSRTSLKRKNHLILTLIKLSSLPALNQVS